MTSFSWLTDHQRSILDRSRIERMLHAPISQIMNTSLDQWQTTRFSVFNRVSRVEVNPRKDLEDMLAKLDTPAANTVLANEVKQEHRKFGASRRKLIALALPCGIIALLSLIYSLIYMVDYGEGIVTGAQTKKYFSKLETFDKCMAMILHEHSKRLTKETGSKEKADDMYKTDAALDDILRSRSLEEWRLISQLNDWRNRDTDDFMSETNFYLKFILDLRRMTVFSQGFELKTFHKWKTNNRYLSTIKTITQVNLLLNILNKFESVHFKHGATDEMDRYLNFVAQFCNVFCKLHKMEDEKNLTCSFELLDFLNPGNGSEHRHGTDTYKLHDKEATRIKLETFRTHTIQEKKTMMTSMREQNSSSLTKAAILFCSLFIFIGATAAGITMFVYVFRDQAGIAVLVSEMLEGVTSRVKEQRESTEQVVNKLIPRNLVRKVNAERHRNMIPYEAFDTTLFMVSIAGYTKFFNMFTAGETIHILTLVMELLDERMEQYNVYPVARMGQYLLVLSESEVQKQVRNACEIANLAIDIMTCCSDLEIGKHSASKLQMKLAIHTGPCHGLLVINNGTVQLKIVGNTLTVLRQIHRAAIPNMIQVSETTQKLLASCDCYSLHYRGNLKIPNMSKYYKVYWLNGRRVSSALSLEDSCSRMGSWIELEKKPLYRLDENDGTYEPLNKSSSRRYSQRSANSSTNQLGYTNSDYLGHSETSLHV